MGMVNVSKRKQPQLDENASPCQGHSLVFHERRRNPHATGQAVDCPKASSYTGTRKKLPYIPKYQYRMVKSYLSGYQSIWQLNKWQYLDASTSCQRYCSSSFILIKKIPSGPSAWSGCPLSQLKYWITLPSSYLDTQPFMCTWISLAPWIRIYEVSVAFKTGTSYTTDSCTYTFNLERTCILSGMQALDKRRANIKILKGDPDYHFADFLSELCKKLFL